MNWFSSLFGNRDEDGHQHTSDVADVAITRPAPVTAKNASLPRFRGTAADQLSAGTRLHDRIRLQLRRAFTPARPIMDPAMLAGRTNLLRTIIRAIEDQYLHVVLFGPRGIGKTSILHVLCGIAQESRYLVRYVSCGERTTFDGLFRSVMADVPLLFHANHDPAATEIEEGLSFADLLDDRPVTVDRASDILGKIAGTRLLIVLDEFDRTSEADFRRAIAELIKNVSDRGSRVQLIIAGVAQNLSEIVEHVPSIRRNILGLLVPSMSPEEIAELISNGQQASGMTFTPKALQLISLAALGLPYLASLVGQHAGFAALDRESVTIDHSDVDRGIAQVLDHLDLRISPDMRQRLRHAVLDGHECALDRLAQVALSNSFRLPVAEMERELNTLFDGQIEKTKETLSALMDRFRLLSLIADESSGEWRFSDDGVPLYLWIGLMHKNMTNY